VNDSRGNKAIAYRYSPGGRLTRMTIDDAGAIDYRYDSVGQLTGVSHRLLLPGAKDTKNYPSGLRQNRVGSQSHGSSARMGKCISRML